MFAGLEAGGTKFLCGMADANGTLVDQLRIPTTTPVETLAAALAFYRSAAQRHGPIEALGIGSFGPLSLNPDAPDYGSISLTPKPGWSNTDLMHHFRDALGVPVALDTDVNYAAIGEMLFGSARGVDSFCYVTVGTGIGVGIITQSKPHPGMSHAEAGHIPVPRAPGDTDFAGICAFHGDCLEGMACGPAMQARWGRPATDLPADHPGWDVEADYLASLCTSLSYVVRPYRIILGGGVMEAPGMIARVRTAFIRRLGGYDACAAALDPAAYIVPPTAGSSAGLCGALAMAYHMRHGAWPAHWRIGTVDPESSACGA